jgi:hypothetical protein
MIYREFRKYIRKNAFVQYSIRSHVLLRPIWPDSLADISSPADVVMIGPFPNSVKKCSTVPANLALPIKSLYFIDM